VAARRRRNRILIALVVLAVAAGGIGLLASGLVALDGTRTVRSSDEGTTTSVATTAAPATTEATTTTTSTTTTVPTTTTTEPAAADGTLELGESGPEVQHLQARLSDRGFWLGTPDGRYGQLTRQAVMAFQKAHGLGRDGVAGPATLAALDTAGPVVPREPGGNHLEIDLARQILIVVEGGAPKWVLNTSTGNGEAYANPGGGTGVATTPPGSFTITREIDGLREAPLGTLYRPKYFNGGIAIHGSGSIPAYPASHGCARLTNAAMDLLWGSGLAAVGTPVLVY
jgi:peptidoglycan hydrolase-like protein with peptidoglycan-binding domain